MPRPLPSISPPHPTHRPMPPRHQRRADTAGGQRSFTVSTAISCGTCAAPILPGDAGFRPAGSEAISGLDCCGDRDDTELTAPAHAEPIDAEDTVAAEQVMPRGRTAADACPRCFIVPASNNTCGC